MTAAIQGIAPPGPRPETLCDPATKTHINDDAGAVLRLRHRHRHQVPASRPHLPRDPQAGPADCNYYGNKEVGDFLRAILDPGATRDWNAVLREATGSGLSADADDRLLRAAHWPGSTSRTPAGRSAGGPDGMADDE